MTVSDLLAKNHELLSSRIEFIDKVSQEIKDFEAGLQRYCVNYSHSYQLPDDAYLYIKECGGKNLDVSCLAWQESFSNDGAYRLMLRYEGPEGFVVRPLIATKLNTRIYCYQYLKTFLEEIIKKGCGGNR